MSPRHLFRVASGCLAALLALGPPGNARAQAPPPSPPSPQSSADPIDLFKEIYPVFAHPRCVNCHGVVQSFPGNIRSVNATHHNEPEGDSQIAGNCALCHDTPKVLETAWQFVAPAHMSFVGKDLEQMCALQSDEARSFDDAVNSHSGTVAGTYLHHLINDPLIDAGFEGRAGGDNIDPPQPPPMSKADFLAAAKKWIDAGAGCGRLTGYIKQTETFNVNYTYEDPTGTNTISEAARRELTINRYSDGTVAASVEMGGHGTILGVNRASGCTIKITTDEDWKATTSNPMEPTHFAIQRDGGSYWISFALPPETTQATHTGVGVNDCGAPPMSSGPETDEDLTWSPWRFTIRCPGNFTVDDGNEIDCDVDTSQQPPILSGRIKRTILDHNDAGERQSWLTVSPVGISRADDGASLPVIVITEWRLVAEK